MRYWAMLFLFISTCANAQHSTCLDKVADFATKICGDIEKSGTRRTVEANGQLKAEVSGILSRALGNASASLGTSILQDSYENVLREDLGKELFNVRDCKIKMVEVGKAEACKKPVAYKLCRHADFGRAGWQKSENVEQTSGWVDGGSNQQNWCNELINTYVEKRSLGSNYESAVISSSEGSNKDMWGHVTYNYSCKVNIKSIPLYAERADARCGVRIQ